MTPVKYHGGRNYTIDYHQIIDPRNTNPLKSPCSLSLAHVQCTLLAFARSCSVRIARIRSLALHSPCSHSLAHVPCALLAFARSRSINLARIRSLMYRAHCSHSLARAPFTLLAFARSRSINLARIRSLALFKQRNTNPKRNHYRLLIVVGKCRDPRDIGFAATLPVGIAGVRHPKTNAKFGRLLCLPVNRPLCHATLRHRGKLHSAADSCRHVPRSA